MVEDYDATPAFGGDYEAWGDIDGTLFCCQQAAANVSAVHIQGGDATDTLAYTYDNRTYNMRGANSTTISGTVDGNASGDTIYGSDATTYWSETLYGESGNDLIIGNAGADVCYGETGADTLSGGAGADTLYGGDGTDVINGGDADDHLEGGSEHDEINGNAGNDVIYGESPTATTGAGDFISGGDGDDEIDGGPGGDVMCGDAQSSGDTISDGDGTDEGLHSDKIWGAEVPDTTECGDTSTQYDGTSNDTYTMCSATLLPSRPSQCP